MRIVIDLQGAQSRGSRNRGIGRYSRAIAQAIVRNAGRHEVIIALSGLFPETIEGIRADFQGLLAQQNLRVWDAPAQVDCLQRDHDWRRKRVELLREAFLAGLKPDVLVLSTVFEGGDDTVTSIGLLAKIPTAVIHYDLIPWVYPDIYQGNETAAVWYSNKLDHLRRADLLLAISESSRLEAIRYLGFPQDAVVNISTAADAQFHVRVLSAAQQSSLRQKFGLNRPFVMYTGGIDHRKNIDGLIRAYALLSADLRAQHQLVVVCSVRPEDKVRLLRLAQEQGLAKDELVLTGYVEEDELIALYNLCKLFVFPPWHEGFGLPALEAMSCGRAVIGSGTSSVPEVIGREDALFDPWSDQAIAEKLQQVLMDDAFRLELEQHGLQQAKMFSWDSSAIRAIAALEQFHQKDQQSRGLTPRPVCRPRLAYLSPLPPEQSGVSDYSAMLLQGLTRHYQVDVIVAQAQVSDSWVKANCNIRDVAWFKAHAGDYQRVLYHVGNSPYHQHMFGLLDEYPGVVVLHEFFVSGILAQLDLRAESSRWTRELYAMGGYAAVAERYLEDRLVALIDNFPCNLSVLRQALGVITHSEVSRNMGRQWYGDEVNDWAVIPLARSPALSTQRDQARTALAIDSEAFVVCSFGLLGPNKLNHRLLEAWLASGLRQDAACRLIFVGENHGGDYGQELIQAIEENGLTGQVHITGWVDGAVYQQYLAAADAGVQVRTNSRGEASAAVLDCMNFGLPTIVNANGSMKDLSADSVWKLADEFSDAELVAALETLWRDESGRQQLGHRAREVIRNNHSPRYCADQYFVAIEKAYAATTADINHLSLAMARVWPAPDRPEALLPLAEAIAANNPPRFTARQLLVDVSGLMHSSSGVQIARDLLREMLIRPPSGLRVEPVFFDQQSGYRYARQFTQVFLECFETVLTDSPVEYQAGDIFLGLCVQTGVISAQRDWYQTLRRHGVDVRFVLTDLSCLAQQQHFAVGAARNRTAWLETVVHSDGALCTSRFLAEQLQGWIRQQDFPAQRPFELSWFHLGLDREKAVLSGARPEGEDPVLPALRQNPGFLMVGAIEERRCYGQVLAAFERLWEAGSDINLVVVNEAARKWLPDEKHCSDGGVKKRLRKHPELGRRLFVLERISDEFLAEIYAASCCLVAAGESESYGFAVLKAAQLGVPIIARDIPVYKEIAGTGASYFEGAAPADLAAAIQNWLSLYEKGRHPASDAGAWLSWKQSVAQIYRALGIGAVED